MHTHGDVFTGQENRTFVGTATARNGGVALQVERALADWSLGGGKARIASGFLGAGRRLAPRLRAEATRRFQPVPKVRFPGER